MRVALVVCTLVLCASCARDEYGDKKSAAREAGKATYKVTHEAEKVAKKAGEKIKEATREVHQGWKEAQRQEKAK